MAQMYKEKNGSIRVRYRFGPKGKKTNQIKKQFRDKAKAEEFKSDIEQVERATVNASASPTEVKRWLHLNYLSLQQAEEFFGASPGLYIETTTDYDLLELENEEYIHVHCSRSLATAELLSRQAFHWLKTEIGDIKDLTVKQVDKWTQSQHNKGYSKSTVQHRLDALRRILDIAVDNKMVPHNVARTSKWNRNKQADNPRRGIKDEEIDALFDAVEKDTAMAALLGGSMEIALWLGRYLGLRNSEAENLPWTQYELDDGILKIPDRILHPDGTYYYPKTSGDMPLADELVERLRDWKYRQEQGIFATKTRYTGHQKGHAFVLGGLRNGHGQSMPWATGGLTKAFYKLRKKARIKRGEEEYSLSKEVSFYGFRHRFARQCLKRIEDGGLGLDVRTVMGLMRHTTIQMTQNYLDDLTPQTNVLKHARL